jgi:hypothetical protein
MKLAIPTADAEFSRAVTMWHTNSDRKEVSYRVNTDLTFVEGQAIQLESFRDTNTWPVPLLEGMKWCSNLQLMIERGIKGGIP